MGEWQGEGTDCRTTSCPPAETQACCLPEGGCEEMTFEACLVVGGVPLGEGTNCADAPCPDVRVFWEHVGSEAYSDHMREYPNAQVRECASARVRECACVYARRMCVIQCGKYEENQKVRMAGPSCGSCAATANET